MSTDFMFHPEISDLSPNVYATLPAVLASLSPGFKQWFIKSCQDAQSSNLLSIIRSLPILPNLESSRAGWFTTPYTTNSNELFTYADHMLEEMVPIPILNTKETHNWTVDYNIVR